MIEIARSYLHVEFKHLAQAELKDVANYAFDLAKGSVSKYFRPEDIEIHVRIEEGSLKSRITIGVFISALYVGIGQYGSFVRGVSTIAEQAQTVTAFIKENMVKHLESEKKDIIASRSGTGLPGKLQRLFVAVAEGKVSAEDATQTALSILKSSGGNIPEAVREEIKKSVKEIEPDLPLRHEENMTARGETAPVSKTKEDKKPLKKREYPSEVPFHQWPRRKRQYGVEVWKKPTDSKRKIRFF